MEESRGRGGRGARLKVLQRMPRIHSWREVIAPRDCWCILHRTTLRPAASSATSTSILEPPSSPTRFPPPLAPPRRNEQRAISLLLNACHKSPRAPSRSPSPPASILQLFHPPPCRGSLPCFTSSPPKTPPSLAQLRISSLAFSGSISLHYVSSLLSSAPSLYLFPPILLFFHHFDV